MGTKLWISACDGKENIIQDLIRRKNLPRAVAMYLAARGISIEEADHYFNNTFADLTDPYRFPGMDVAVKRLWQAIRNRERILIHGDYDTDGITARAWKLAENHTRSRHYGRIAVVRINPEPPRIRPVAGRK